MNKNIFYETYKNDENCRPSPLPNPTCLRMSISQNFSGDAHYIISEKESTTVAGNIYKERCSMIVGQEKFLRTRNLSC